MIGRTLGGFRVIEQIGIGGMATVFKAYDASVDRYVAIKTLPHQYSNDPSFRARFEQEAKAIAKLEHIHILPMFAYGEEEGTVYIAMRYLEAGTLKELMERESLSLKRISRLIRQIADALDYAHSQEIFHRDIKPSNILIDHQENALLMDFGIAKIVEGAMGLTGTGIMGTPEYMSPEQFQDSSAITSASDQYSLGVVLYEMVTKHTPYEAETPFAILQKHIIGEPLILPRTIRPDLPIDVEQVLLKALASEPIQRFSSCVEMAEAFERAISHANHTHNDEPANVILETPEPLLYAQTVTPKSPQPLPNTQTVVLDNKPASSNRWMLAGIGLVIIVIGMIAVILSQQPPADSGIVAIVSSATASDESPAPTDNSLVIVTPTATDTSEPTATDTPEPTATDTSEPTATHTLEPTATHTLEPTATDTSEPTATFTITPSPTYPPPPTAHSLAIDIGGGTPIFDDFSNTDYDGILNPFQWFIVNDSCEIVQQDGVLTLEHFPCDLDIGARMPINQVEVLAADFLLPAEQTVETLDNLGIRFVLAHNISDWGAVCGLGVQSGFPRGYFYVANNTVFYEDAILLEFDQWARFEMSFDPDTFAFSCTVNGQSLGSYIPKNQEALERELFRYELDSEMNALVDNVVTNTTSVTYATLDIPTHNETVSGIVDVDGWALVNKGVGSIDMYLDGEFVSQAQYGGERFGVRDNYSIIPDSLHSGYTGMIDTRQYENGRHTLAIWVTDTTGNQMLLPYSTVTINISN